MLSVVSGWTVEQSTNSLFLMLLLRAVSIVSWIAASSPTQVKIMSAWDAISWISVMTLDFPDGRVLEKSSARLEVRL